MNSVGILAYGSLIKEPGTEIEPLIIERVPTQTPFPVEFARLSRKRGYGPTLVPYETGVPVHSKLLILSKDVSFNEAKDMLWRRECGAEGSGTLYPAGNTPNSVRIEGLLNFLERWDIFYTDFLPAGKLAQVDPAFLAQQAIASVGKAAAGRDGISYLAQAIDSGVRTALSDEYVAAILTATHTASLQEALASLQPDNSSA